MSVNSNRYLSVYKVLRKGELMVVYTVCFSIILSMIITVIVALFTERIFPSVLLTILSFIFPIFIWQHQLVKWKIRAFSRVNNIPKLLLKAGMSLLGDDNLTVTKTVIPYREKKNKIEEILWNRRHNNLFEVELADTFLPTQKHIYYSFIRYVLLFLVGFIFLYIAFQVPTEKEIVLLFIKILVFVISILFLYISIKRLINRQPIITIDSKGIYTIKSGFVSWGDIGNEDVSVSNSSRARRKVFRFHYLRDGNIKSVSCDIETLNVSVIELDEIIEIYRNRYNKQQ